MVYHILGYEIPSFTQALLKNYKLYVMFGHEMQKAAETSVVW